MVVFWVGAPCTLKEPHAELTLRPDDGGSKNLWNVDNKLLPDYTEQQPFISGSRFSFPELVGRIPLYPGTSELYSGSTWLKHRTGYRLLRSSKCLPCSLYSSCSKSFGNIRLFQSFWTTLIQSYTNIKHYIKLFRLPVCITMLEKGIKNNRPYMQKHHQTISKDN
jgi:hypothetical protein